MKQGWEIKKLGNIAVVSSGNSAPQKKELFDNGTYPFIRTSDVGKIRKGFISSCVDYLNIEGIKGLKLYKKGTILFPKSGASTFLNHRVMMEIDSYVSSHLATIKGNDSITDDRYLLYFLTTIDARNLMQDIAYPSLKTSDISLIPIPIPSLKEQQRIVAILDETFVKIAKAKANAEQNLKNAKELFESYLQGVFENKGEGWVNATIGETCNLQTGGTPSTSKKEFYEGGSIKWLVSGDINQKVINDCEGRITELGMNSSNTKYLPINSVLIALNGQGKTRGTVAMLRTKATCNQSLVSIFPKDEKSLLPELVFLNLEGRYDEIRKMTGDSGNDRRGLNMPLIRSIKFSHPKKLLEQKEIICKLDNLRTETKKLEVIYNQKINDLEELKKSVLHKAFSGELKTANEVRV
jgi:type I restriction enzyme S subunit